MRTSALSGHQDHSQMKWPCGPSPLATAFLLTGLIILSNVCIASTSTSVNEADKNVFDQNSTAVSQPAFDEFSTPADNSSTVSGFRRRMLDTDSRSAQSIDATSQPPSDSAGADWTPIWPGDRSVTQNDRVSTDTVSPAPVAGRVSRSASPSVTSFSREPPRRSPPHSRRPTGQGLRLSDRLASSVTPTSAGTVDTGATPPIPHNHGPISEQPPRVLPEVSPAPSPVVDCEVTRQGPGGYCRNNSVLTVVTPDSAQRWRLFSVITLPSSLMEQLKTTRVTPTAVAAGEPGTVGPQETSTATPELHTEEDLSYELDDVLDSQDEIVFPDDAIVSDIDDFMEDVSSPKASSNSSNISNYTIIDDLSRNISTALSNKNDFSAISNANVSTISTPLTESSSTTHTASSDPFTESSVIKMPPTNTSDLINKTATEQASTSPDTTTHRHSDEANLTGDDIFVGALSHNETVTGDIETTNAGASNSTENDSTSTVSYPGLSFNLNTTMYPTTSTLITSTAEPTVSINSLDNATDTSNSTYSTEPTSDNESTTPTVTNLTTPTNTNLTTPTSMNSTTPTSNSQSTTPISTNRTTSTSNSQSTKPTSINESTTPTNSILTTPTNSILTTPTEMNSTTPPTDRTEQPLYTVDSISRTAAPVPVYVRVVLLSTLSQFCHMELQFREYMAAIINQKLHRMLTPSNVIVFNVPLCGVHYETSRMRRRRSVTNDTSLHGAPPSLDRISLSLYITDNSGRFSENMTRAVEPIWAGLHSNGSLGARGAPLPVESVSVVERQPTRTSSASQPWSARPGLVIAVVLAALAVTAAIGLLAVLFLIRRRRRYRQDSRGRCNPVSLEQLGTESVFGSLRRHGKIRRTSLRSYMNQAFDQRTPPAHLPSNRVNFAGLANMASDLAALKDEFDSVPSGHMPSSDEMPPGTEACNRYANVLPIAETRVVLHSKGSSTCTDYINANYIRGPNQEPQYYIATQAPLESTTSDFWRMVWQSQCRTIVCLTDVVERGVRRCAEYLPPSDAVDRHRLYGEFQVTLTSKQKHDHYVISRLQLKSMDGDVYRELKHLWFSSWPDRGVPDDIDELMKFMLEIRRAADNHVGPLLVHCSPGTGRTGVVLACDTCMRQFDVGRSTDVLRTVSLLRQDRAGAVQTRDQYALIYKVLNHYATAVTSGNLPALS